MKPAVRTASRYLSVAAVAMALCVLILLALARSTAQAAANNNNNNNPHPRQQQNLLLQQLERLFIPGKRRQRQQRNSSGSREEFCLDIYGDIISGDCPSPSPSPAVVVEQQQQHRWSWWLWRCPRGGGIFCNIRRNKNRNKQQHQADATSTTSLSSTATATMEAPDVEIAVEDKNGQKQVVHRLDETAKSRRYHKLEFPLFQKGDGSDEDPDGIPTRYMRMQLNRREHARHALQSTLNWRKERDIDSILKQPHADFDIAKAVFPHYFVSRDVDGHVVFVQRPALLDLQLAEKNGLDNEGLLNHYVYVNEYLWQIVEADNPLATMTSIIDLHGLHLGVLRHSDIMHFLKVFVKTMDAHYPQRANRVLVVNTPKWFNMIYKLVSPLLRESTKAKIEIMSRGKKQDKALKERLGKDAEKLLPPSFFSKKKKKKHHHHRHWRKRKHDEIDHDHNHDHDHEGEHVHDDHEHGEHEHDHDDHHEHLPHGSGKHDLPPPPPREEYIVSDLEEGLRSFTLARLKEARVQMQDVEYG